MRKLNQTRLRNLEILVHSAGSATTLARLSGTTSSYLSQVRRQLPTAAGQPRTMGTRLAEKLEMAMNKPKGWMDNIHRDEFNDSGKTEAKPSSDYQNLLPLISWAQAGEWSELSESFASPYGAEVFGSPVKCSSDSFVLRVSSSSMEPEFKEGSLVFVDPGITPENGSYVVVRSEETNEASFKQLMAEGGENYLKVLNPNWPRPIIELEDITQICGVVVFKGDAI